MLNLRYPGQYYDAETATNYNLFRNYEPAIGRYQESDPTGLTGGISTFAYSESNPLFTSDPYGLWTFQLGLSLNAQLGVFNVNFNVGLAFDGNGDVGTYTTVGGGGGGADAGGGVSFAGTNADNISDLAGTGQYATASAGDGFQGSIDGSTAYDDQGNLILGGGFTLGIGAGADFGAGENTTTVSPLYTPAAPATPGCPS